MQNASIMLGALALCSLTACSASDAQTAPAPLTAKQAKLLDKQLAGKTAGEPVKCIYNSRHDNIIRVSDDMLLYRVSGNLVYQNKLRSSCPGLARDNDIILTESFGSQTCRGDIIKLIDRTSGIPGGFCSLGDFVPYRKDATGS